jgi:amidase
LTQAQLIRAGEISPLELTELYLQRIEALNPRLGSFFYVGAEAAIATAKQQTERLVQGTDNLPPFFGIPIGVKDLNPVAGSPCSYGIKAACDRIAQQDDGIVYKLKQAGFIILGKTATSQLGSLPYTEPPGFAPARNPWNLDYTPGGSSGGAAASVAAGLSPIAQGSDGGGSIRGPAACCGLVGIKPSRGRISFAPVGERLNGLAASGPIARTVADAAALLDVMAGYIPGDPYWLPDPDPAFVVYSQRPPGVLRIGFSTTIPPMGSAIAESADVVTQTAQRLDALGHQVEAVTLPDLGDLVEPFTILWRSVLAETKVPWVVLDKMNRWLLLRTWFLRAGQYLRAVTQVQRTARRVVEFCQPYDVLLLPVYLHPTIAVGEWANLSSPETLKRVIHWVAPCPPFNASGQPVITVPTGFDARGLPVGVQLVGRPGDEATLISLAAQLEQAHPWSHHRPKEFSEN